MSQYLVRAVRSRNFALGNWFYYCTIVMPVHWFSNWNPVRYYVGDSIWVSINSTINCISRFQHDSRLQFLEILLFSLDRITSNCVLICILKSKQERCVISCWWPDADIHYLDDKLYSCRYGHHSGLQRLESYVSNLEATFRFDYCKLWCLLTELQTGVMQNSLLMTRFRR